MGVASVSKDPRIDAYIKKAAPFAQPILIHLRKIVHAGCPDVEETVKWSVPAFYYKGPLCGMAAFKQHCTFGFWKSQVLEERGIPGARETTMGARVTSLADLPDEKTLIKLVKAAAALNDEGVKVERPKAAPKPPVRTPSDVLAAIKKNKKAFASYEAFSPSHKREYVEWITEAKTEDTRQRRLTQAVAWMAEGKPRNWKYMR